MRWLPIFNRAKSFILVFLPFCGALIVWEVVYRLGLYSPHLFPGPSSVGPALLEMYRSGELIEDLKASSFRWVSGYTIGTVCGIAFGMFCGRIKLVQALFAGLFNGLSSIPKIVLIPLSILWFGLGETQKLALVAWGAFFPVWLYSMEAVLRAPVELVWLARTYKFSPWQAFWHFWGPSSIPHIVAGMRVGISTATFSLAAAEMSGAFSGLAYRVFYSYEMFQTDKMMAGIVLITALSWLLNFLFMKFVDLFAPWAAQSIGE